MKKINTFRNKIIAVILAVLLAITQAVPVFAADPTGEETETFNYVSIGASNTNGYGLYKYFDKNAYEHPAAQNFRDYIRINHAVEGSYPTLVRDWLKEKTGKNVSLSQLAGSGMRSHELRLLLDETYYGDRFTELRFYNTYYEGDGTGGKPEKPWFGNKDSLAKYRSLYKESIEAADFISIDIGENDFTSFLMMALLYPDSIVKNVTGLYDNKNVKDDINQLKPTLTDKEKEKLENITRWVNEKILPKLGNEKVTAFLDGGKNNIADTIAYSYICFCKNFDESIKKIRELNPDAKIVVLGIQNPLAGLKVKVDNYTIPAGDIMGSIIDLANVYLAGGSVFKKEYTYTNCGVYGCVENIGSDLAAYNGDPTFFTADNEDGTPTQAKAFALYNDCLESYLYPGTHVLMWMYMHNDSNDQNNLLGANKTQVDLLKQLLQSGSLNSVLGIFFYALDNKIEDKMAMNIGVTDESDGDDPRVKVQNDGNLKRIYDVGYLAAWNLLGWITKAALETDTIDIGSISELSDIDDIDDVEEQLMDKVNDALEEVIENACTEAITDENITINNYDYSKVNENSVKQMFTGIEWALLCFYIRSVIANSVALHPNLNGHKQLAEAVEAAYETKSYKLRDLRSDIKDNLKTKKENLVSAARETVVDLTLAKISDKIIALLGDKIKALEEKADSSWIYNTIYQLIKAMVQTG